MLPKYKYDTKQTWQVMKEIIGKQKKKSISLPEAIKTRQGITGKESEIAKELRKYSTSVGTALASKIPIVTKNVIEYLSNVMLRWRKKKFETRPLVAMVLTMILFWMSTIL